MLKNFKYTSGIFGRYAKMICDVVVPYQGRIVHDEEEGVAPTYAIENFKNAALKNKSIGNAEEIRHRGPLWLDSDVAKWIEVAAYSLAIKPDAELERKLDEVCDIIGEAQDEEGYLDTFYLLRYPDNKFTNLCRGHEMYCFGHMMEAAVALYEITGNKKLINIMCKNADMLYRIFVVEGREGYPGHPEIELALLKLWRVTDEKRYLELSKHFVDVRGLDPDYFVREYRAGGPIPVGHTPIYSQSHLPVRMQRDAVGHAVRAVYLYTAMADLAAITKDKELEDACFALFESIEKRRMYITGAIGSTHEGEAFTVDFHLPNDTGYAETCASVGLTFFASKLLKLRREGRIADVMERAVYNTVLACPTLDGKKYFYSNLLEVIPDIIGHVPGNPQAYSQRQSWLGCACCPPNAARLLASIVDYAFDEEDGVLYSNMFVAGELTLPQLQIELETAYPFGDTVKYKVKKGSGKLAIHIPSFSLKNFSVSACGELKNGYYYLDVKEGDEVLLTLDMAPRFNRANTKLATSSGMAAVSVGPVIYCIEEADNENILAFTLDSSQDLKLCREIPANIGGFDASVDDLEAVYTVVAKGSELIADDPDALYFADGYREEKKTVKLIPYFMWGNRGPNKMRVWIPIK